jgi:ankyrin repeat protein
MPKHSYSQIKSTLSSTANDAKKIVTTHLDAKSLCALDQVKAFRPFTQDEVLWKKLAIKEFSSTPKRHENESYKKYYHRAYPLYLKITKALNDAKTEKTTFNLLLEQVIENGYELLAPLLIDKVDINIKFPHKKINNTFLHLAAVHGELEILTLLLNKNANVDMTDYGYVLFFHSRAAHSMTHGTFVESMGSRALARAAERGHTQCMMLLIQHKAKINHKNGATGETALHCAARAGELHAVNLLLQAQARVDIKDKHGNLALELARNNDHIECAEAIKQSMRTVGLPIPPESTCVIL